MDLYNLIISAKLSKGEGGDVSVDPLSVTENGTYTAEEGHAYSPVSVNVPSVTPTGNINITSTAQTDVSAYATAQVVDADLVAGNIKKDVNILGVTGTYEGGGGGGSSYTLLHEEDIEVSTTSTSTVDVKTISVSGSYTSDDIIYVRIYDKAGFRADYFYGSETFEINVMAAGPSQYEDSSTVGFTIKGTSYASKYSKRNWSGGANGYGILPKKFDTDGSITISARYNSNYSGTIDGTYHIEVYKLAFPNNVSPFIFP